MPRLSKGSDRTRGASMKTGTDTKNTAAANANQIRFALSGTNVISKVWAMAGRTAFPDGVGRIVGAVVVYEGNVELIN